MIRIVLSSVLVCGLAAVTGCAESTEKLGGQKSEQLGAAGNTFFRNAAINDMTELQSSQLAVQRAQNAEVRSFAQQMIDDHTGSRSRLQKLAQTKGVELPKELDTPHAAVVKGLPNEQGPAFDRAYMAAQVTAHQEAIANYETAAKSAKDSDVKQFAEKGLPMLREHLEKARQITERLK